MGCGGRCWWLWERLSYYAAVLVVGIGLVHHLGIPREQQRRLRKLTIVPYFSAILLASVAGVLNPLGIQLLWQSALPQPLAARVGCVVAIPHTARGGAGADNRKA